MKIVVCDDDALVYEQMKNIIASYSIVKNENLELTFYQTVEELLHAKHKYDILFLDIRFNNCDIGIDVAKKLRKAGNTSLIILLTSLHSKAIEGYEIGAYRYIVKPIIKEKMYAVLDEAISSIRSNYRVILVKDMYNTVVVKIQQILYIYSNARKRCLVTLAMLGPIGLQVYEKQVQALEAGALEQLVLFLIIMLTVNIVAIIIENLDGLLTQKMQLEITRNFGKPVFEYIQNVPLYHMSDSNFVADKERAINAVENDILLVVQNINGSIALIVSIIVLSVMVAQYDVLALVVLIIMVIVQNVFTKRGTSEGVELNKSLEMFKIKEAYFNKLFVDKNSSKEIRQWRLTDYIEGKRYWLNEEIKRKTLDLEKKWTGINLFWACVMYFFEFIYYIVLYIRYTRGSVMLGTLIYLIQVLSTYLVSFTQVIQHIKIIASIKYEIDTYFEFAEKTNGKPNIAKSRKNKSKKIIFENVDFEYKKRRLLQEISFSINPGEKILIVGENGSGKSTLLNLILGLLQPTRGKVDIGANKIALMAQESYKFNITIRESS